MEIPIQKFRQRSIFEKPSVLFGKQKFWWSATTIELNIFCWNFAHVSYLPMSAKGCSGYFFCLELELMAKIKSSWFLHTQRNQLLTVLLITQDLNKMKKSRTTFCKHWPVGNVCKISTNCINPLVHFVH